MEVWLVTLLCVGEQRELGHKENLVFHVDDRVFPPAVATTVVVVPYFELENAVGKSIDVLQSVVRGDCGDEALVRGITEGPGGNTS